MRCRAKPSLGPRTVTPVGRALRAEMAATRSEQKVTLHFVNDRFAKADLTA